MGVTKKEVRSKKASDGNLKHCAYVVYDDSPDEFEAIERKLTLRAKQWAGEFQGAGFDGCERDVEFAFPTKKIALAFLEDLP